MAEILALDLGSSSVRALALDGDLRPVARARKPASVWQEADGTAMLDADGYVAAAAAAIDDLHGSGALRGVTTVAASCQWHSLIPLDSALRPLGPGLSWMDTRAVASPGPDDPAAFHARTGAWWHALYWPMRIAWLGTVGVRAGRWAGLGELLAFRFLGTPVASVSSVSGTGALDTVTCRWDPEALALAGIDETAVPEIAPDDWRGRLVADCARRWPDLAGAAWSLPIGDGAASALGTGCTGPHRLSVTVGTSAAVRIVRPGAAEVAELVWRYRLSHDHSVVGVAYSGGGVLFDWVTHLVGGAPSEADLDALAPGQHGLVSLPFHAGRRPPLSATATGTLYGLRLATTSRDVVAATLEGVCHELADGAALLGVDHDAVAVLGGGAVAASPWFARRLAASFGGRAVRCLDAEVGARGAASFATGRAPSPRTEPVTASPTEVAAMASAAARHRAAAALPPPPR